MALVLALMILSVGAVAVSPDADASPAQPVGTYTVYGYIGSLADENNEALGDVEVHLLDSTMRQIGPTNIVTDSEGMFQFTYDLTEVSYLRFELGSYTVRTVPEGMSLVANQTNIVAFDQQTVLGDIRDILAADPNATSFPITGDISSGNFIGMMLTTGQISGFVYGTHNGSDIALEGAEIMIVSGNYRDIATTDRNGLFVFNNCPYGEYTLTVTCSGFQDSEGRTVYMGDQVDITLTENSSSLLFGLTTPYAMELIGLVVVALVVVFSGIAYFWSKKRSDPESVFVNDLESITDEEEEDVRRP